MTTPVEFDYKLAEALLSMGHNPSSSIEECHRILSIIDDVPATSVSRAIAMMSRTHSGLAPSVVQKSRMLYRNYDGQNGVIGRDWNVEVFVRAVHEHDPLLNWDQVLMGLDHPEFFLHDRRALHIVTTALSLGFQLQGHYRFPIEYIYKKWRNVEGQLSYIRMILHNPDIFSFIDHVCHAVPKDILKVLPDFSKPEVKTWLSMDLVELLLYIGSCGFTAEVLNILQRPISLCPDLLSVALVSSGSPMTELRKKLLQHLLSGFFNGHPNSSVILYLAWNSTHYTQQIRQILMQIMVVHCKESNGDQSKLVKVMDVAQDLKTLLQLLDTRDLAYKIELANLASRRQYLKLDKWVEDKLLIQGESFLMDCLVYLQGNLSILSHVLQKHNSRPVNVPEAVFVVARSLGSCIRNGFSTGMELEIRRILGQYSKTIALVRQLNSSLHSSRALPNANSSIDTDMARLIINSGNGIRGLQQMTPNSAPSSVPREVIAPSNLDLVKKRNKLVIQNFFVNSFEDMPAEPSSNIRDDVINNFATYFQGKTKYDSARFLYFMKILKDSEDPYDKKVLYFMIRHLVEDYVHLLEYNDVRLQAYSHLFGGIIQECIVT